MSSAEFVFFINPCSGSFRKNKEVCSLIERNFSGAVIRETHPDAKILSSDIRFLTKGKTAVAVGGDGTLRLLINAFYPACRSFSLIPSGTANVISIETGISTDQKTALEELKHSKPLTIDLGYAEGQYFLLCAGIGFDAEVVRNVNLNLKKHCGKLAYFFSFLRTLFKNEPVTQFQVDDKIITGYSALIQNFSNYAGKFRFSREVSPSDGKLNVIIFQKKHWGFSSLLPFRLMAGFNPDKVFVSQFSKFSAHSSEKSVFCQFDGDPGSCLPCEITVIPEAVDLLLPDRVKACQI